MISDIRQIFDGLQNGEISLAEAEQSIIDLWEDNQPSTECNCTYFTVGVHSDSCPQRIFSAV